MLVVVAGAAIGALAWRIGGTGGPGGGAGDAGDAAGVPVEAHVSGLDPSGGSGLARSGDGWRTQTYVTADFGGLKPGVGLLLDVGTARELTSVTLEASPAGATIGLRAADERPTSGADLPPVGEDVTASGTTVLDASSGGAHRYWLIWVSGLGSRDGGFGVTLTNPVVTGPPAG